MRVKRRQSGSVARGPCTWPGHGPSSPQIQHFGLRRRWEDSDLWVLLVVAGREQRDVPTFPTCQTAELDGVQAAMALERRRWVF